MTFSDSVIRETYKEFNASLPEPVTADDILCDPALEESFWAKAYQKSPIPSDLDRASCNKRLLALRKLGENKGGLPRTRK